MEGPSVITTAELEVARAAAARGGAIVVDGFRTALEVRRKGSSGLVTEIDVASEQAIVSVIREAYPDHAVLGEESHAGDVNAEHLWVIDPLDGTNNFAHGVNQFAVSIAYYHAGVATCGVVLDPTKDIWYVAARGQGAFRDNRRAEVSRCSALDETLVGLGFYYDRGAMMEATLAVIHELFGAGVHGIRRFGTASLDLCEVGCGGYGAFFEYELSPWDFAAGRLFVEEAGGRVTTCDGHPLPLASSTVLATNGRLHDAMRAIVERHHPRV